MAIKKGDIIKVQYEGTLDDGTVFDSTEKNDGEPLKFEVGSGQLIKGFENAMIGKDVGEEFEIKLQPSDAYGAYNPKLTRKVPKDQFPEDQAAEAGMILQMVSPNGMYIFATIKNVEENEVTLDLNHPMAGKTLNFKIKILETGCEPDASCNCSTCGSSCDHDHDHDDF